MRKIPGFRLVPEPLDQEARDLPGFKWTHGEIGRRHQLGGSPNLIQELTWPECPNGHGKMTFYSQLDSINDDFCLADCGMIYVFICLDCYESKSLVQSS